ncbi:3-hydroxyacyl-CoA dehydrogenase [Rhodobacteraceae bacterium RKSG542]|nr:3-hydroxyacyl-CoA dehydrogenase [Pseudovibrio flavus]
MTSPSSGTVHYSVEQDIAVLAIENPPVNALSNALRSALFEAIERFENDETASAAVLYGVGAGFIAGADIREFSLEPWGPTLPELIARIEACEKPVIAALHGNTLGGGVEVALASHYRIAQEKTRLGMPEVHIGLIPGASGTQRLPRLIGYDAAIAMITGGRPVKAKDALQMGLVDELTSEAGIKEAGIVFAQKIVAEERGPRRLAQVGAPAADAQLFDTARAEVAKKAKGLEAPSIALEMIANAARMPYDAALAIERRTFLELKESAQHKALVHAFFADRSAGRLPELKGVEPRPLSQVGVVGGGTMGAGIATALLLSGFSVVLVERDEAGLDRARSVITANLEGAVKRGKLSADGLAKLTGEALVLACEYEAFSNADLVIEAVFEEMSVKHDVFSKLDAVCKQGAILATNTSYLDVNAIAACTSRPQDVIGLHFFSPAHIMKLLEVVVANATAADVLATGFALAKKMGKVAVRAGVCDGFIGNRILAKTRAAAEAMILEGASPKEIDSAIRGFGFAMGPFETADMAGLDISWARRKRLAATRDPRDRQVGFADAICEQGWFGRKTGSGYYLYGKDVAKHTPNPDALELIEAERVEKGIAQRSFSAEEIVERYMAAMVNEAAAIISEGIALRPVDVDLTLLYGYGFPRWRGGPMHYADAVGAAKILDVVKQGAKDDDYFWRTAPLLEKLAEREATFASLNG